MELNFEELSDELFHPVSGERLTSDLISFGTTQIVPTVTPSGNYKDTIPDPPPPL